MNREKFEALPEIVERIKLHEMEFCEKGNLYYTEIGSYIAAAWVTGAYYAFCEQEKRIAINKELRDLLNKEIETLNSGIGKAIIALSDGNNCDALDTLKEILK